MPIVSAIVPSYNHEPYLAEAIESVLNQSIQDLELIIIDNGSSDGSPQIIEDYAARDSRIRMRLYAQRCALAKVNNDAIDMAAGKYLAFLGSDDAFLLDKMARQVPLGEANPLAVICADGIVIDAEGNEIDSALFDREIQANQREGNIFAALLRHGSNYIYPQTMLVRREFLHNIRLDERFEYLCEYQFILDLAKRHPFLHMPEPVFKHRIHDTNMSLVWDRKLHNQERAALGMHYLKRYEAELAASPENRIFICQTKILDALLRGDHKTVRQNALILIAMNPASCAQIKGMIERGQDLSALKLEFDTRGEISVNLGKLDIGIEDLKSASQQYGPSPVGHI